MKNIVLFCTGLSGSGKSYFIKHYLPPNLFYSLKSATTRPMREGEKDGHDYYFRDEQYFSTEKLATLLWVNEEFWMPGQPKWLYGVPEFEIYNNLSKNLVYDVIQPKYIRQMIDWFKANKLSRHYDFKTIYFIPPENNLQTIQNRANMPNDKLVRQKNTCNPEDFLRADVDIDFLAKCSASETIISSKLLKFLSEQIKTK